MANDFNIPFLGFFFKSRAQQNNNNPQQPTTTHKTTHNNPQNNPQNTQCTGRVPIDSQLTIALEKGENYQQHFPNSVASQVFKELAQNIIAQLNQSMDTSS